MSGTATYTYDKTGRPVSLTRQDNSNTTYAYDEAGNIAEVRNTDAQGRLISSYAYTYDKQGFITGEDALTTNPDGTAERALRTFTYNENNELATFTEKIGGSQTKT